MFSEQTWLARILWSVLLVVAFGAVLAGRWPLAFVALSTFVLSVMPVAIARWAEIYVPPSFVAAILIFIGATLFLGEVFSFYERFWWWDIAMHAGSALGFGMIGFVLVFMMFQGDRYAAPPLALAFFAFCFAVTMGTLWELFEFAVDQLFETNMQRTGLLDTMGDLIVNMIGAAVGAGTGFAYLRGQARGGLGAIIDDFIRRNPRYFKRRR